MTEKGISKNRITALGMGESEPYVMEQKDGNLKIGDVLTESYIKKMRFRKIEIKPINTIEEQHSKF